MASRVLSIEINQVVTKVCEMEDKSKTPKVYKSFMVDTPEGVFADGTLDLDEGYVAMLKKAISLNKVKAKKVIFSIASSRIASREVTIPYVKANKVEEVIEAKAEEYFPVDLADYKIAHTLLGVLEDEKGNKRHKVLVLAIPLKLIQGYYDLASACGMEVQALDYMGNSLFQAVKNTCVSGTQLVAKIDEYSTLIMVVQDGNLISIRSIGYGVNDAIHAVMSNGDDDEYAGGSYLYEDAIVALRQSTYIQPSLAEREEPSVKAVTTSLAPLVNGISRVIDYHNPKSNGHPIERMFITGLGGSFKGMSELLQESLTLPVAEIRDIDGLIVSKNFDINGLGDFIGCIGATMAPLDLLLNPKKKKKEKAESAAASSSSGKDNSSLMLLLGVGGIAIAVVLAAVAILPYKEAEAENRRLLARIEQLKPVEEVHNTYIAAQNLWTDANNMDDLTKNHNQNLVAFIRELENKMPQDIIVLSMVANANDVTMNIDVSSKESAAKVLQELEKFETIQVVETTGLSDARSVEDIHVVSFSVNCIYAELQEVAEETVE
uniref:pilus assembly protein PilM n=1 Tax=Acetatifactor sp. TaxID=1872090 RepID=UPI004057A781